MRIGRWESLVSYTNDIYYAIKAIHPNLPIFPSFALYINTTEAGMV